MSEELKPCPLCGGEAKAFFCEESGTYDIQCQQCGALPFLGRKRGSDCFKSMDDVIAAWNRRAERTCRMEYNERWSHDEYYPTECYNCSECGHMTYDGVPTFCPNCGAKVVDE